MTDDPADPRDATIRRLRAENHKLREDVAHLEQRLAYADLQITQLRAMLPVKLRQAAVPVEPTTPPGG